MSNYRCGRCEPTVREIRIEGVEIFKGPRRSVLQAIPLSSEFFVINIVYSIHECTIDRRVAQGAQRALQKRPSMKMFNPGNVQKMNLRPKYIVVLRFF